MSLMVLAVVRGHVQDAKELNKRRCDAYQEFIDQTNRKPSIFRDIIIESECVIGDHYQY